MNIQIREFKTEDLEELSKLFYDTVHSVNSKDYSEEQLFAWARSEDQLLSNNRLLTESVYVAVIENKIVGFGSVTEDGYLDFLYVHKDDQHRGIVSALVEKLEEGKKCMTTCASITALPFFKNRGYAIKAEQTVVRQGVTLTNFLMEKHIK